MPTKPLINWTVNATPLIPPITSRCAVVSESSAHARSLTSDVGAAEMLCRNSRSEKNTLRRDDPSRPHFGLELRYRVLKVRPVHAGKSVSATLWIGEAGPFEFKKRGLAAML